MSQGKLFEQILNPANRHNPYPSPISQHFSDTIRLIEPPHIGVSETEMAEHASQAITQMTEYFRGLIATRRDRPSSDLISALVVAINHDGGG